MSIKTVSSWRSLLWLVVLFWPGCKPGNGTPEHEPLVSVGSEVLTKEELRAAVPEQLSPQDSMAIAEDYISRWIRNQLMLRQAEMNLSPEEKDVEKLLDEYRTSLLVHLYQQKMLEQKHSPLVTSREIEQYYEQMKDNFNLQESIIRGVFIKVRKDAPEQSFLQRWYRSTASEDLINLEAYCFQHARTYEQFIETWVPFRRINSMLPQPMTNELQFLRWTRHYETSDEHYNYYLAIHDFQLPGSAAPVAFVEERIRAILLNKKRIEFIETLGKDLYEAGLRERIVNFY